MNKLRKGLQCFLYYLLQYPLEDALKHPSLKKQIIKVFLWMICANDAAQQQSNNHMYESGLHNHNNHQHAGMLELPQLLEYYAAV